MHKAGSCPTGPTVLAGCPASAAATISGGFTADSPQPDASHRCRQRNFHQIESGFSVDALPRRAGQIRPHPPGAMGLARAGRISLVCGAFAPGPPDRGRGFPQPPISCGELRAEPRQIGLAGPATAPPGPAGEKTGKSPESVNKSETGDSPQGCRRRGVGHRNPARRRQQRAGEGRERGRGVQGMVGAIGFEPTTLWSQTRCATRLRYAPTPPF